MSRTVLRVADLRAVLGLTLDAFEAEHGQEIEVARDHYWHLPVDASFDVSHAPDVAVLTVGQVSDDLAEIHGFLAKNDAGPGAWHALSHVIGLLRLAEDAARP